MPNHPLTYSIQTLLERALNFPVNVTSIRPLNGGSVNSTEVVETDQGAFFIKHNRASQHPNMFKLEQKGLELLRLSQAVRVPTVYGVIEAEGQEIMIMEMIDRGTPHYDFWPEFGAQLARLHKTEGAAFGLDYDNFISSIPQTNAQSPTWASFFHEQRLAPMLKRAVDSGKADIELSGQLERLGGKLAEIFPVEKPALLHGDLWGGNFISDLSGDAVIFDPAVYFGHREMDLSMTRLFGGFDPAFYHGYEEEWALEPGWEERVAICNLYPLLVHVNLFAGSYIQSVRNVLNRF
jgi:protein-ribulosamine 3-kinase